MIEAFCTSEDIDVIAGFLTYGSDLIFRAIGLFGVVFHCRLGGMGAVALKAWAPSLAAW
jgi:hypothetical protein